MDNQLDSVVREIRTRRDSRLPDVVLIDARRAEALRQAAARRARSTWLRCLYVEAQVFTVRLRLPLAAACLAALVTSYAVVTSRTAPRDAEQLVVAQTSENAAFSPARSDSILRLRLSTADLAKLDSSFLAQRVVHPQLLDDMAFAGLETGFADMHFTSATESLP